MYVYEKLLKEDSMMVSMRFYLRVSTRKGGVHAGRLYLRVICNRRVRNVATPHYLYPEEWSAERGELIYPSDNDYRCQQLKKMEGELTKLKQYLEGVIERLEEQDSLSAAGLINAYRCRQGGNLLRPFVEKLFGELAHNGQERTARAYRTAVNGFLQFCGEGKCFEQLNASLMLRYEADMKRRGLSLNTISFYMRNLRAIYNRAIREQVFEPRVSNPFETVFTGVQQTRKRALTKDEMQKFLNLSPNLSPQERGLQKKKAHTTIPSFTKERCPDNIQEGMDGSNLKSLSCGERFGERCLSFFAFAFFARGMSFVDLAFLKKSDIQDGVLSYYRKKTGAYLEVKLTKEMKYIIRSFGEETKDSIYLFPIITRTDVPERLQYESALRSQNNNLKKLAELCGIQKTLSTHVARHTWATVAKEENLPLAVISEGLGHTSEKTTAIYLASFSRTVLDKANSKVAQAVNKSI